MRRLGSTKNRSLSVDSNPWNPAGTAHDAARTAFDLGERVLGGGGIDDDDAGEKEDFGTGKGFNFEWSLDGGEIMFLDEHGDEVDRHQEEHYDDDDEDPVDVVFGAAGVALSPRAMKGRERDCCGCCCGGGRGMGLGLYVIEEEGEEMEVDGERQGGVRI